MIDIGKHSGQMREIGMVGTGITGQCLQMWRRLHMLSLPLF